MQDLDKMGVFYLGDILTRTGKPTDERLFYESKNFTTHAVCLGMTGSGKTGLGIALLEEAGLDKIPAIIIDPKGDMSNLLLTFPHLTPNEFRPWIDDLEAAKKGLTPEAYAAQVAQNWKEGLASSGETVERIQKLRASVDMEIYTPANSSGTQISIFRSFAAPSKEVLKDADILRDRILSLTSSVLGLIGIKADPIKSREHILISTLIEQAWKNSEDLDLNMLIQLILKPPFNKIGALDIESFYPLKQRSELSIALNNLLASPGFLAWMKGAPLDIKQLLYTDKGKPRFAIFSIAHLSDSERMFFVTLLLNEIISWMRQQPGTSSLRALLYMDEIFGYFPPSASPPSKLPMLTLLKQARAYGVGIMLATQNPVDLDYKGLANCGTWFLGKLQTARDKSRVTEGLKQASNGELDADDIDKLLSGIKQRTFIMRSIYEPEPVMFKTRWTLSYLRGPLTLSQIQQLTPEMGRQSAAEELILNLDNSTTSYSNTKPMVPAEISEFFLNTSTQHEGAIYRPRVLGKGKLHYVDAKHKIDFWQAISLLASPAEDGKSILWEQSKSQADIKTELQKNPLPRSQFAELPPELMRGKNYSSFEKSLATYLYQSQDLKLFQVPEFNLTSKANESEGDFRTRVTLWLRENRDETIQKLREKYAEKIDALTKKIKSAQDKVAKKQEKAGWQKAETFISIGSTILGALFGRGVTKGTIDRAGTSIRKAGKIGMENRDAAQAEEELKDYQDQLNTLHEEMQKEIDGTYSTSDIDKVKIDTIAISPRKNDIDIDEVALVWISN